MMGMPARETGSVKTRCRSKRAGSWLHKTV